MEKGVKQGKSSYPLLSMKKDQANKTNVERVYRQWPLAWEPGPNRSSIDLQLVQRRPEVGGEGEGRLYHDTDRGEINFVSNISYFTHLSQCENPLHQRIH